MSIIAWDIDDVLCFRDVPSEIESIVGPDKYEYCQPNQEQIDILNAAYAAGHEIVLYTSRGMAQFNGDADKCDRELREVTTRMLLKWGVQYHSLVFGKIHFDLIVDDKAANSADIKSLEDIHMSLTRR